MHRAQLAYAGQAEESALVEKYSSLIDRVARRLVVRTGSHSMVDDLWSVGALALLDASRRFDPSREVRFESFAEYRIRGAMLDELRRMDHLPRRLRARTEKLSKTRQTLAQQLGRECTAEELAAALGVDLAELAEMELLQQPLLPLTSDLGTAADDPTPEERLARRETIERLSSVVGQLPERLQLLLTLYYVESCTYREIAPILEVSEARVCQLHSEALRQVRHAIELLAQGSSERAHNDVQSTQPR